MFSGVSRVFREVLGCPCRSRGPRRARSADRRSEGAGVRVVEEAAAREAHLLAEVPRAPLLQRHLDQQRLERAGFAALL